MIQTKKGNESSILMKMRMIKTAMIMRPGNEKIFNNDQDENDKDSKDVKDPKREGYAKED